MDIGMIAAAILTCAVAFLFFIIGILAIKEAFFDDISYKVRAEALERELDAVRQQRFAEHMAEIEDMKQSTQKSLEELEKTRQKTT